MSFSIVTDDLFDGTAWTGPATLDITDGQIARVLATADRTGDRVAAVMPGLADFGVRATGYQEPPFAHPFAPESAFATLCLTYGVTGIVEVASGAPIIAHLRHVHQIGEGPRVTAAHARLVTAATDRNDLHVAEHTVEGVVRSIHLAGAQIISVGATSETLAAHAADTARQLGLSLVTCADPAGRTPGLLVTNAAGVEFVVPQLEARKRWTVDGLAAVPDGHLAAPFLPFSRHFVNGDKRVGRRIARKRLREIYPDRDALPPLDDGSIREALLARRCLAGSGAGAAGIVPGLSLWRELKLLEALDVPQPDLLHAATAAPRAARGADGPPIQPGAPADLLLLDAPGRGQDVDALRRAAAHVVVGGHRHSVAALAQTTSTLVHNALEAR